MCIHVYIYIYIYTHMYTYYIYIERERDISIDGKLDLASGISTLPSRDSGLQRTHAGYNVSYIYV